MGDLSRRAPRNWDPYICHMFIIYIYIPGFSHYFGQKALSLYRPFHGI